LHQRGKKIIIKKYKKNILSIQFQVNQHDQQTSHNATVPVPEVPEIQNKRGFQNKSNPNPNCSV